MCVHRYLDLLTGPWISLYNTVMKIFFISSSAYLLYLIKSKYRSVSTTCGVLGTETDPCCCPWTRPSQDPAIDTFRLEYIIGPCAVLGLIFNYKLSVFLLPPPSKSHTELTRLRTSRSDKIAP